MHRFVWSRARPYNASMATPRVRAPARPRMCKHYTSNTAKSYRKMATEILRENNGYGIQLWEQVCDEPQHHKKNWNDANNNKQLTMHNKYTNDDVDFDDCVAHNMH